MNLRKKLMIVSVLTYVLIFSGFLFYTNIMIMNEYLELESDDIIDRTEIGLNTLELRIRELDYITREYASRDDTYYFIQNNMRHFINSLISTSSFIENEINFMIFLDELGEVRYSKAFDLISVRNIEINDDLIEAITENRILLDHSESQSGISGLISLADTPVMISSHPIVYSDEELTIIGTLICGRYVNSIEMAKLCSYSYQNLKIIDYDETPIDLQEGVNVWRQTPDIISGLLAINDINGNPLLVLEADIPRDLYIQGRNTVVYFYIAMLSTGGAVGLLAVYLLNKVVLERILGLSREVSNIDPKSLESKSLSIPGDDEISRLSKDIDDMLNTISEYQDMLTKQERMATIGETAAMVGHDLRNPLQVIYMLESRLSRASRQLMKNKDIEPITKELELIKTNLSEQTGYMNKIVSDLQDFSKSISIQVEDVDMESMVVDVIRTMNVPENVEVSINFEMGSNQVQIDGNYFRRVIVNLLTNAVQAMPDGGKLSVKGEKIDGNTSINVSDTGTGISEENMTKLFTPLFTTKAKGTGLGLAVCKRIVDAHNGSINVESVEGEGTSFTINIPDIDDPKPELTEEANTQENVIDSEKNEIINA